MQVLKLIYQHCPQAMIKLPIIGEELGFGADGQCFSVVGNPNIVIKLGILYERHDRGFEKYYKQIENVLEYVIRTQPCAYMRVYEFGYLGTYSRPMYNWQSGTQKFILYYYTMEKLLKISEDERKVFHSILSHEDRGIEKKYSPDKINKMLQGMSRGLDFDAEKVMLFCDNIKKSNIIHYDLHVRNIMKNNDGEFRLIDVDRCEIKPLKLE